MRRVVAGRASNIKLSQNTKQNTAHNAIPDQLRLELPTTTIGTVAQQVASGNYATEGQRRRGRGGRRVRR